ncbi:MAG: hypothetical protein CBD88_08185 [Flavobacteriales bacterium TMED228]|nr:MAG: hypothetical protein CBD88_08185 [Flavobacteriales bacterium TMED228]|tara:strand:+ start:1549 stop:3180 length:1632 start_codon:yes stop_codon:yes gene_type:complete
MGLLDRIGAFDRYKVSPTQGTSGLLTGAGRPMSPFAQQAARQIGGALGMDMRTPQERLAATVKEQGLDSPEAMQAVLANLAKTDPARAVQLANQVSEKRKTKELQTKRTEGIRAITAYVSQLSTDELLKPGARAAVNELERTYDLEAGKATELLDTELGVRSKASEDKESLPVDYQNYLLAVPEGQRETVPYGEWIDRNKGGTGSSTEMERAYSEAKAEGALPEGMTLATYKNTIWSPPTPPTSSENERLYSAAIEDGYKGTLVNFLQDVLGKGKTPEIKTFEDKDGFKIYSTGPNAGKYVRKEARNAYTKMQNEKRASQKSFEDLTIAALEDSNIPGIKPYIDGVRAGTVKPEDALKLMRVPEDLVPAMNDFVMEGAEARSVIKQDVNLLADYNLNVPPVGTPASQLKKAQEWWTGGDNATLTRYNLEAKRVDTTNFRLPTGAASDVDVARAESTVPPANSSPEIVRSWLLGQMKIKALIAAESEAKAEYMMKNAGSLVGFNTSWAAQAGTEEQTQEIYKKYGVPPTPNFIKKTVQAGEEIN